MPDDLFDMPDEIVAGDSLSWTKTLTDYPAGSSWVLKYYLHGPQQIQIDSSASGDDHLVEVLPAVSAKYDVGTYHWAADVTDGTDRHQVESGKVDVLPDLAALDSPYDAREWDEIALDNVRAVIQNRATMDQMGYVIGGRRLDRTPLPDLIQLEGFLVGKVKGKTGIKTLVPRL